MEKILDALVIALMFMAAFAVAGVVKGLFFPQVSHLTFLIGTTVVLAIIGFTIITR